MARQQFRATVAMQQYLPWVLTTASLTALAIVLGVWVAKRLRQRSAGPEPLPVDWDLLPRPLFTADERRVYRQLRDMLGQPTIATGGTDFDLATASDSDNLFHVFEIDLLGKKRYIDFEITGGNGSLGTYLSVLAILSRPGESPDSATEHGAVVYGKF